VLEQIYGTQDRIYKDFEESTNEKNTVTFYKQALALITTVREEVETSEDGTLHHGGEKSSQKQLDAVFLVHGHDGGARELVARFLEKLKVKPIILHEQPNQGRTVIEKLEHNSDVAFAVVLLTPDDVGGVPTQPLNLTARARQNVILELGFFVGRLGRRQVCALYKGQMELPSDFVGVVYVPLDEGGGWRLALARELKAAGFPVDMNRAV
jgi:predicted nucleotide-binding protein